ncbi:hypothetical protein [Euzebyella saccharophila]|uniref:Outer membrane protein beta-barrel domain-containing protein n=1 Tax=Euzebyella saccharophila TaxID=679664 RepID=A0ABV8JVA7_9FLAO|nr:hypothetical protein [Euzebyella saccharophila]
MKKLIFLINITCIWGFAFSQDSETYFTKFRIKDELKINPQVFTYLMKNEKVPFFSLSAEKKQVYINLLEKNRGGEFSYEARLGSGSIKKTIKIPLEGNINYSDFLKDLKFDNPEQVVLKGKRYSYVKFSKDSIIVNPWLVKDEKGELIRDVYYYKLENRQKVYLNFSEITLSGLTIPLKYRFRDKNDLLKEQFNASFNANVFIGYTFYGRRSFFYRKDVGNKSNNFKVTAGTFVGASTIKLNNSNTNLANEPIMEDTEITEGLASYGFGVNFSFNKLNFGVFTGWDKSVGENADKWNYNNRAWLGLAIGYSLLKI